MLRFLGLALAACSACSPAGEIPHEPAPAPTAAYATQLTAPAPDYRKLIADPPVKPKGELRREATLALPPDAKRIGQVWIDRLQGKGVLGGYGLGGKSDDGPVVLIHVLLTARDFDAWLRENGWAAPRHIDWGFQPELVAPMVSEAAAPAVRLWTASETRTGVQLQMLDGGRVVMKDGCLWMQRPGQPDRLAWLHAETGLDRDAEGFLVFINRMTGETMARLGEDMTWAGPNPVNAPEWKVEDIRRVCGEPGDKSEIYGVGNPQSAERMYVRYPHLRDMGAPPPPPGG